MWWVALLGCIDTVNQVAGTGSVYSTRCSAEMSVKGDIFEARCQPAACLDGWRSGPVNQVIVAMDPGNKIVGYAERVCLQDLSNATALYAPAGEAELKVENKP